MSMRSEAPEQQKAFYHSSAWLKCRDAYLKSVGGLCERCADQGRTEPARIVHHKEYVSLENITDPEVLLDFDNLEALCQTCHNQEHHTIQSERFILDQNGRIIGVVGQ